MIKVKQLHQDAVLPQKANDKDAGYDLVAISDPEIKYDNDNVLYIQYKTGIAIEPPEGYHTEIYPRSSISKYNLQLCNSLGLIDEPYRGEIILRFNLINSKLVGSKLYQKGDKIGQLVIKKTISMDFIEVEELEETDRADGSFGSSGN